MLLKRMLFIGSTVVLLSSFLNEDGRTRYFLKSTVPLEIAAVQPAVILSEGDSIQDTLYRALASDGRPMAYYRTVTRSVCFDKQCRILKANIYWNITGRYLGFELPKGEFFSKAEHEPFTNAEYLTLNKLLADSLSPLKAVKASEMIPKADVTKLGVDGVTSPTTGAISAYVVKGAGYTTYAMWHLVYGETQNMVSKFTEKALNNDLLLAILNSEDTWDKQWAMDRLPTSTPLSPELEQALLANINDDDFSLAENTLQSIKPVYLGSKTLQLGLLDKFSSSSYNLKNSITFKLSEAPYLDQKIALSLATQLSHINGELFINILNLFQKHSVYDEQVLNRIADLLSHQNRFISSKSYEFLRRVDTSEGQWKAKLRRYESAKNQ